MKNAEMVEKWNTGMIWCIRYRVYGFGVKEPNSEFHNNLILMLPYCFGIDFQKHSSVR